jgi:peroxiredoxin
MLESKRKASATHFLAVDSASQSSREVQAMLNVGDVAPDFEVPAHTGEKIRLSSLKGQRVVLWFYPAADTPG